MQQHVARAGADAETVELHVRQREQPQVAPEAGGLREVFEQVRVSHADVAGAGDLKIELVVDGGACADAQLDGRAALVKAHSGLRRIKAEVGGGLRLRSGDDELRPAAGAEIQERADEL